MASIIDTTSTDSCSELELYRAWLRCTPFSLSDLDRLRPPLSPEDRALVTIIPETIYNDDPLDDLDLDSKEVN